jgi:hypothetical protein
MIHRSDAMSVDEQRKADSRKCLAYIKCGPQSLNIPNCSFQMVPFCPEELSVHQAEESEKGMQASSCCSQGQPLRCTNKVSQQRRDQHAKLQQHPVPSLTPQVPSSAFCISRRSLAVQAKVKPYREKTFYCGRSEDKEE